MDTNMHFKGKRGVWEALERGVRGSTQPSQWPKLEGVKRGGVNSIQQIFTDHQRQSPCPQRVVFKREIAPGRRNYISKVKRGQGRIGRQSGPLQG
jgi:hypothetical protein